MGSILIQTIADAFAVVAKLSGVTVRVQAAADANGIGGARRALNADVGG